MSTVEKQLTDITDKVDGLTGTVGSLSIRMDDLTSTVGSLTGTVDTLSSTVGILSGTVDKVLNLAVETNSKQGEIVARLTHLEDQHSHTFEKIDGFLTLINRHESEIAALRASMDRMRERMDKIEQQA